MSEKPLILVIDDDVLTAEMIGDGLDDRYRISSFTNPLAALSQVVALQPALILLDINMPQMDGYEVCRRLKGDEATSDIPVVFLSGLAALEDRLAAYDAGGEDFTSKPLNLAVLASRIETIFRRLREKAALANQASFATATAMTAMSTVAELGLVVAFARRAMACASPPELARALLDALAGFGVSGAVALTVAGEHYEQSQEGETSQMEHGVLQLIAGCGRIVSMGQRAAFNFDGVTLLVRDMPVADDERAGRLRDHCAVLGELVSERVQVLALQQCVGQREGQLRALLQSVHRGILALESQRRDDRLAATALLESSLSRVERDLVHFGLTESQEDQLMSTLRQSSYKVLDLYRGDPQAVESLKQALASQPDL
jgi:DNA-binding response OmpR family regulator